MHVVVATTVHHPRDARISVRQIPALLAAGHEVTYVAAFAARGVDPPPGVTAVDVPRSAGRRRLGALRAARRTLRSLGTRADLVLVHDPELLAVAVGGAPPAPLVWDVHEDTPASLTDRPWIPSAIAGGVSGVVRRVEERADRHLRLILAEDRYRDRFVNAHPVVHNYPVVPEEVPPSRPGRAVYVGRLSSSRGLATMVQMGPRLASHGVTVELLGPPDDQESDAVTAAAGRGDVTGTFEHVPNDLALARVEGATAGLNLVADHPNHRVSLQTKVLEYLAHGVPVVTTPIPAAAELLSRHDCGVVVPFGDVDGAVDAVRALHADDARREAMARRGHAVVARDHNWVHEGRRFVTLLESWAR